MTLTLSPLVRKEVRALAPIWMAAMAPLVLFGLVVPAQILFFSPQARVALRLLEGLGLLAFVLGVVALGAMSVGHEYAHCTLAQLLAQPDHRHRLFRTKRAVLALFLLALTGAAAATVLGGVLLQPQPLHQSARGTVLVLGPVLALFVAPWLTMVCRNPLAGIVFTLAIPAVFWITGEVLSFARADGVRDAAPGGLRYGVLWAGVLTVSAVAAFWSRRTFLLLEVRGYHDIARVEVPSPIRSRAWARGAGGQRVVASPLAALLRKELRLQSITMIVAGLYVALWAATLPFASSRTVGVTLFGVTILYAALIATLAGAIPSAEERALGTLEWQMLQPRSAWTQWVVKAGTALVLALGLAFALPILLETIYPRIGDELLSTFAYRSWSVTSFELRRLIDPELLLLIGPAMALVLITSCGVYISSVCAAGVRALILTWPLVAFMVVILGVLGSLARTAAWDLLGLQAYTDAFQRAFDVHIAAGIDMRSAMEQSMWVSEDAFVWSERLALWLAAGLFVGLTAMLLRLGFTNHRIAERDHGRIVRQLAWLLLFASVGSVLQGAIGNVILRAFATIP